MRRVIDTPHETQRTSPGPDVRPGRRARHRKRVPGERSLPAPLRRAIADLTPPFLHRAARRAWHGEWTPAWTTVERWIPPAIGWDHGSVARVESEAWPRHVRMNSGTGVFGAEDDTRRVGRGELWRHNMVMSYGYVLMLAEREAGAGALSILDWGGGVGQLHLTARAILPWADLRYEVRDLPGICHAGRKLQPDVVFHDDDECLRQPYDLVVAMGSLQYSHDWSAALAALAAAASPYLFIYRQAIVFEHPSYLVRQRAYDTEYVSWMINREEFLASASQAGLALVREFLGGEEASVHGAPEQFETRGFLFRADGARPIRA
jgi:putative methyltransferase (TIGR04325 family)